MLPEPVSAVPGGTWLQAASRSAAATASAGRIHGFMPPILAGPRRCRAVAHNAWPKNTNNAIMSSPPPFIAPSRFDDPAAALAQVRLIYDNSIAHLREQLQRFVA